MRGMLFTFLLGVFSCNLFAIENSLTIEKSDFQQVSGAQTATKMSLNNKDDNNQSEVTSKSKMVAPSAEMKNAMANMAQSKQTNLTTYERVKKYIVSGFLHIVPKGLDHIVFIMALFLSTAIFGRLIWQVTVFTLAHSLTLALSVVWGFTLSASIVEPLIALSIVYVAVENIRRDSEQNRYWPTFAFGLLHGFGFAFVLKEFGLSGGDLTLSLLSFNIGVELGQLAVLASLMVIFYRARNLPSYRMFVQIPGSILVAILGLFWLLERII